MSSFSSTTLSSAEWTASSATWSYLLRWIAGMCAAAYHSVAPAIRTFRLGGEHPWDEDKDISYVLCPDAQVGVTYEVKRLR